MTIATTSSVLLDSTKRCVMQFTGLNDGPYQETDVLKADPKQMNGKPKGLSVSRIMYDVAGGLLIIAWDAYEGSVPFLMLTSCSVNDYNDFGGVLNLPGPDAKGGIVFSTLGFDSGSSYCVTLDMVKKY